MLCQLCFCGCLVNLALPVDQKAQGRGREAGGMGEGFRVQSDLRGPEGAFLFRDQ